MKNKVKKLLSCYACGGDLVELKSETGAMFVCKDCKRYNNFSLENDIKERIRASIAKKEKMAKELLPTSGLESRKLFKSIQSDIAILEKQLNEIKKREKKERIRKEVGK